MMKLKKLKSFMKKFKDKRFAAKCDREVIRKGCDMLGMEVREVAEICIEGMKPHAAEIGLEGTGNKKAGKFSLGMKQRLGIGMALLGSPEFLILDEPINGLDPQGIIEMRELIKRLNEEKNMTIMISSHILGELQKVATVFGIISEGKLVTEVTAEELKNSYIGEADSLEEFYLDIIRKGQKAC